MIDRGTGWRLLGATGAGLLGLGTGYALALPTAAPVALCWIEPAGAERSVPYVSGIAQAAPQRAEPRAADGTRRVCIDVPAQLPPTFDVEAVRGAERVRGVLVDGSPGPLALWGPVGCRLDLNADGAVGLSDVGQALAVAARGDVCR